MKIIVSNDDGIDAPGLAALVPVCQPLGDVVVVAPDCQQSSMGHQVTTLTPISVIAETDTRYRIGGTPADCARIAISQLVPDADLLVAGINRGGNLGADVYLSGTVAAAREAALLGIPGIAISHHIRRDRPLSWERAAFQSARVLEFLLGRPLPSGVFWNVNLPALPPEAPEPPIVTCTLDISPLHVRYRRDGDSFVYEGDYQNRRRRPGHDVDLCFQGNITVTPIPLAIAETVLSD